MRLKKTLIAIVCLMGVILCAMSGYQNVNAADIARVNGGQSGIPAMDVVDISSNNGYLSQNDFEIMKRNGVRGIIVKLTEGTTYKNPYASSQINNARAAGLTVSAYHFATYTDWNNARDEAAYFVSYANELGLSKNTLMVNDLEDSSTKTYNVSSKSWAFDNEMKLRGFSNTALYTYVSYKNSMNLDTSFLSNDHIWMAQYPYNPSSSDLWNRQYGMWQWSSNAGFWGISGTFDVSVDYAGIASTKNLSLQFIDNSWYLIDLSTGDKQTGQQYYQNKWYLFDSYYGNMQYGLQYLSDGKKWVYYDKYYGNMQYGRQSIDGRYYMFDGWSGARLTGQQYIDGKWYLLDNQTGEIKTGWQTLPQGKVYYDWSGAIVNGQFNIDGSWYLFDRYNGALKYGEQFDDGHWYLFDKDTGKMQYGFQYFKDSDKWVYYDTWSGTMQFGSKYIDNKLYIFDNRTGKRQTPGEVCVNGNWYFINSDNTAYTGWKTLNQGKVYYGPDGAMSRGEQFVDGSWYLFNYRDGSVQYGQQFISSENKWVLFDRQSGHMQFGIQYDQGNWYYFDHHTGAMAHGKTYLPEIDKWAYYDMRTGTLQFIY
ncbi:hypothetical protein LNP00_00400 [Fructobacillus sp. M158]|uniref:GH25 family lysozyme n=1 Tax=Fructobacillus parabroussonetiae TaxID=2713174 RepID=UPI00200A9315|nr:GH25 family lysozyme [Fructobacillus parabroussonetiae]MCK8616831.1 hypothetical protein [Fructobacillus parabroussonetiae]